MPPRYINTVPGGRTGTGNATVYGANPVAAQFGNQLVRLRENEYEDELLLQKKAEAQAKLWRDNQLAASEGRLWAGDMGKIEQDHIQKGIELRQKGVDPYGVTQPALEYQKERRAVEAQQGFRKATEVRLNALNQLISANPDKYEPEDIQAINDFFEKTKLGDAYNSNTALPQLRERLDLNQYLTPVKALTKRVEKTENGVTTNVQTVDRPATLKAIQGATSRDPRAAAKWEKMTSGVPVEELEQLGNTIKENEFNLRALYSQNAPLRAQFARDHGVRPFSPEYDTLIDNIAKEQTRMKQKFNNEVQPLIDAASQGIAQFDERTPVKSDEMTPYQKAQLELAKQRIGIQRQNAAKKDAGITATNTRVDLIQRIQRAEPGALEEVVADINGNPEYDKTDKAKILNKDGKFFLHVPKKIKLDTEGNEVVITQSNDYPIVHSDPNFISYVNSLIGNTTGAKVDIGSMGAKSSNLKKSPPLPKTAPAKTTAPVAGKQLTGTSVQLEEAAKKKGMTKAEYKKALQDAGYTVTEK